MWRVCFGRSRPAQTYHSFAKDNTSDFDAADAEDLRKHGLQRSATCNTSQPYPWDHEDSQRDALILAATPACFTVVSLDDRRVLRQNLTSRLWMGDRVRKRPAPGEQGGRFMTKKRLLTLRQGGVHESSTGRGHTDVEEESEDLLALIFKHEPDALAQMLQELVNDGDVWKGVVRVPPEIKPSGSAAAAEDISMSSCSATAVGAALQAAAVEPHLASAIEYDSAVRGGGAAMPISQQPLNRIRKLFQKISRGATSGREPAAHQQTATAAGFWEGGAGERDGPAVSEIDGEGHTAGGGVIGCLGRLNSCGDSQMRRPLAFEAEQGASAARASSGQPPGGAAPGSSPPRLSRDTKVMRLTDMMMSMLLEDEENPQGEIAVPSLGPPSVGRVRSGSRPSSMTTSQQEQQQQQGSALEGSTACGCTAGRAHAVRLPMQQNKPASMTTAIQLNGGGAGRLDLASTSRRRSSSFVCLGGVGSPALQGSDSFSRPTTATVTTRSTPSATNPNLGSAATSAGVAVADGGGGGGAGAAPHGLPSSHQLAPSPLRDANPLSTSTLTLSLVRRACMSNAATVEGEPPPQNAEPALGSLSGSNRGRRGPLRRVVSCYDSRSGDTSGAPIGAPIGSQEDCQMGDEDGDMDAPPLPPRVGSSVGAGLLSSLGVGEAVQYVNASARLLTFAAHLKSAPMATQMLAGVAPISGAGSAVAAAPAAGSATAGTGGNAGNSSATAAAASPTTAESDTQGLAAMRTSSMSCMEAMAGLTRSVVMTRGSLTASASPLASARSRYTSAPSQWHRYSMGRFLTSSIQNDVDAGARAAAAAGSGAGGSSPFSTGGGDPRVAGGSDLPSDVVHSGMRQDDSMSSFLLLPGSSVGKILATCSSVAQQCGSSANTLRLEPWYRPAGQPDPPGQRGFGSSTLPHSPAQGSARVSLSNHANVSAPGSTTAVAVNAAAAGCGATGFPGCTAVAGGGPGTSGNRQQGAMNHNHHDSPTAHLNQTAIHPNNQMLYGTGTWAAGSEPTIRPASSPQPAVFPVHQASSVHAPGPVRTFTGGTPLGWPSAAHPLARQVSLQPCASAPYQRQQLLPTQSALSHPELQPAAERQPLTPSRLFRGQLARAMGGAGGGDGGAWGVVEKAQVGDGEYDSNTAGCRGIVGGRGAQQRTPVLLGSPADIVEASNPGHDVGGAEAAATGAACPDGVAQDAASRQRYAAPGVTFAVSLAERRMGSMGAAARSGEAGLPVAVAGAPPVTAAARGAAVENGIDGDGGVDEDAEEETSSGSGTRRPPRMADGVIGMLRQALASQDRGRASRRNSRDECWHEIWASRASDPITDKPVLVLVQHDVTAKVVAERHLALVMETEHRLLEQLFPRHILAYITEDFVAKVAAAASGSSSLFATVDAQWRPTVRDCKALATWHPQVTLLFADIKGFTPMCKEVDPPAVMAMLNDLYSRYDQMLDEYGVFKVETIGDCYFVAGGLIQEDEDGMTAVRDKQTDPLHAQKIFDFARAMLAAAQQVRMPTNGEPVQIRIGLHTGPVVSGVVGTRMPRFCLFGDTVNTASRMESTGESGAIHASEATYSLLRNVTGWIPTGGIQVKGKGLLQTYLHVPGRTSTGTGSGGVGSGSNRRASSGSRRQRSPPGSSAHHHYQYQQDQHPQQQGYSYGPQQLLGIQVQSPTPEAQGFGGGSQRYSPKGGGQQLERDGALMAVVAGKPLPPMHAALMGRSTRPSISSAGTSSVYSGTGSGGTTPLRSSATVLVPLEGQVGSYADLPPASPAATAAAASAATAAAVAAAAEHAAAAASDSVGGRSGGVPVDSSDVTDPSDPMTTCMDLIATAATLAANTSASGSAPRAGGGAGSTGGSGVAPRCNSAAQHHGPMNLFGEHEPHFDAAAARPSFEGFPKPVHAYSGDRCSTPPVTTRVGALRMAAERLLESALSVLALEHENGDGGAGVEGLRRAHRAVHGVGCSGGDEGGGAGADVDDADDGAVVGQLMQ